MPKMGQSLFAGMRHVRERRRQPQPRCHGHGMGPGLRHREVAVLPKVESGGDLEAPPLTRRRVCIEGKHFGQPSDEGDTLLTASQALREEEQKIAELNDDMAYETKIAAIDQARKAYEFRKKEELKDLYDEDDIMKKFARRQLLEATSNADLMMTAEIVIDEDWLGKVESLPGNIYRLAVMGDIFVKMDFVNHLANAQAVAKIFGVLSIVLIQILGPPLIFFSRMQGWGVLNEMHYQWQCCPWHWHYDPASTGECAYKGTLPQDVTAFDDWHHIATTKLLGMLMISAFILNGLFVVLDEKNSWKQIYNTFRYLDVMNNKFRVSGTNYLYLDALVNVWVIGWCCIDVFLVIGASASPAEVLMNALGLVFLYNLDDVGGDLGFVNEDDWPGARLAWIYQDCVHPCDDEIFDEDVLDWSGWFIMSTYNLAIVFLVTAAVALPVLAAVTPFIQIVPE